MAVTETEMRMMKNFWNVDEFLFSKMITLEF